MDKIDQIILGRNALKALKIVFSQAIVHEKEQRKKELKFIGEKLTIYFNDYLNNSHKNIF